MIGRPRKALFPRPAPPYDRGERGQPRAVRYAVTRDQVVRITATPQPAGTWWAYWLVDGELHSWEQTATPTMTIAGGAQAEVVVLLSRRELDWRMISRVPRARRWTIEWLASADDEDLDGYRVEIVEGASGGTWRAIGTVGATGAWSYRMMTGALEDDTIYRVRIVPVQAGCDGTPATVAARRCVRHPDSLGRRSIVYNDGEVTVT